MRRRIVTGSEQDNPASERAEQFVGDRDNGAISSQSTKDTRPSKISWCGWALRTCGVVIALLAILVTYSLNTRTYATEAELEGLFETAQVVLEKHELPWRAEPLFKTLIKAAPPQSEWRVKGYNELAKLYITHRNISLAAEVYGRLTRLEPWDIKHRVYLAATQMELGTEGNLTIAAENWEIVLRESGAEHGAYSALGRIYYHRGNISEGINTLWRGRLMAKYDQLAYFQLADALGRLSLRDMDPRTRWLARAPQPPKNIERTDHLTIHSFVNEFSRALNPLIIEGEPSPFWEDNELTRNVVRLCGQTKARSYAGGDDIPRSFLTDCLSPSHMESFCIPRYFAADIAIRARMTPLSPKPFLVYNPSSRNTVQDRLNVEMRGSHMWYAVLAGSPEVKMMGNETFRGENKYSFLHTGPREYKAPLSRGDLLFIPAGTPYSVVLPPESGMIGMQWWDESNWILAGNVMQANRSNTAETGLFSEWLERKIEKGFNPNQQQWCWPKIQHWLSTDTGE